MTHTHAVRLSVAALAAAALITTAGCTNTRPGDPVSTPSPDEYGNGEHISSVLNGFYGPAPWVQLQNINSVNCPDPVDTTIFTTGATVTAVDTWDETGNGSVGTIYVQDTVTPLPPYAGIAIFDPTYSPPDLKIQPGEVVDVAAIYEEYIGPSDFTCERFCQCETLPQLEGAVTFRFDGKLPEPVVITPDDLANYASGRKYLGMLVRVTGVSVLATGTESDGRYSASIAVQNGSPFYIDDELWDVYRQMPLTAGATFTSVTGIVTYFGSFNLAPRSAADFQ